MRIMAKSIFKAILFCIVFTALFVVFSFAKNFLPQQFERFAHGIIGTIAALLTTYLFLKFDKKTFADIGLVFQRTTLIKFLAGMLTGIVIMGSLTAGVLYFSHARVELSPHVSVWNFLLTTSALIPLAYMEELGFRAYPLQALKDKVGIRWSIVTTSILFALYHVANGWSIGSSFYGPGIWGLIFGIAAIYSNGIAMPTGIHYAANLTTSAFGAASSSTCIWIVKQSEIDSTKHAGLDWSTILPAFFLLVFAIVCIEAYQRRKPS
jgi:membrane protease YdiL (CAAX protease family)